MAYGQLVWALAYHKAYNPRKFWEATILHCNSSYRPWVHKHEAQRAGVLLKSKNYKLSPSEQFLKQKWWVGKDFIDRCFIIEDDDNPNLWLFRGLVANSRTMRRYGRVLKFVTIGVGSGEYIDVVVKGDDWDGNHTIVQGAGYKKISEGAEYIDVVKTWSTWFN